MKPVLEFDNVVRSYKRGVPVLNGVSMTIHEGEVVAILGRTGACKTTPIRIAMGILYPQGGSVMLLVYWALEKQFEDIELFTLSHARANQWSHSAGSS